MANTSHRYLRFSSRQTVCVLFILSSCLIVVFLYQKNIGLKVKDWTESGILSVVSSQHHYTYTNLDPESTQLMFERTMVDDYNKVIYCPLTKVASTSWKKALLKIQNCRKNNRRKTQVLHVHSHLTAKKAGLKFLSELTPEEASFRLETYFKFIFKRHPLDRLVSAYKDKFQTPGFRRSKQFHQVYGRDIVKQYRENATESALESGSDVTFVEFVRYVIDQYDAGETMNQHWATMDSLCKPFDIHYDFIGAFENLSDDVSSVMGRIYDGQCDVQFPTSRRSSQKYSVPTLLTMEYMSLLDRQQLCKILEIYKDDFEYFQYDRYYINCRSST